MQFYFASWRTLFSMALVCVCVAVTHTIGVVTEGGFWLGKARLCHLYLSTDGNQMRMVQTNIACNCKCEKEIRVRCNGAILKWQHHLLFNQVLYAYVLKALMAHTTWTSDTYSFEWSALLKNTIIILSANKYPEIVLFIYLWLSVFLSAKMRQ